LLAKGISFSSPMMDRDKLGFELCEQLEHIAGLSNGSMNLYLFTKSPPTSDKPTHVELLEQMRVNEKPWPLFVVERPG